MQNLNNEASPGRFAKIEAILAAGLSLDRLANEAVIERGRIEQLLSGESPFGYSWKDEERDAAKLEEWLAGHELATSQKDARTPTFGTITALLAKAHSKGEIISITGGVGIGKSQACKAYVKDYARGYDRPGAFYVEFGTADKKMTAALERILAAMLGGQAGNARTSSALLRVLCSRLKPGDFMVLDECNYLVEGESRTIDIVRDIHAATGVGIALLGNPDFDKRVYGKSGDFDALASRAFRYDFPVNTEQDIDCWIQWKGLGMAGKQVRDELVRIGKRPGALGGLRTLSKLFDEGLEYKPGETLTVERIRQFLAVFGRL